MKSRYNLNQTDSMRGRGPSSSSSSSLLDAAALQADLARRLNLVGSSSTNLRRKKAKKPPPSSSSSSSSFVQHVPEQQPRRCPSCHSRCSSTDSTSVCSSCGYFVNGVQPQPTSLAQRRGLVAIAPQADAMSEKDWESVESKLDERQEAFCPICMEGFNKGHEVLLSCSHMFHRACLQAFEKFVKVSERICPICRTSSYQKKITRKGSVAYSIVCATKIQALYRGYVIRRPFYYKKRAYYAEGKGSETARNQFYSKEMTTITNAMSKDIDRRDREIDHLVNSSDQTLLESRQLDMLFETMMADRIAVLESSSSSSISTLSPSMNSRNDHNSNSGNSDRNRDCKHKRGKRSTSPIPENEWNVTMRKALDRGLDDCAICMGLLCTESERTFAPGKEEKDDVNNYDNNNSSGNPTVSNRRRAVLLSCSHAFHANCISNFERFSCDEEYVCPVCRSVYQKRPLTYDCTGFGDNTIVSNRIMSLAVAAAKEYS